MMTSVGYTVVMSDPLTDAMLAPRLTVLDALWLVEPLLHRRVAGEVRRAESVSLAR